MTTPSHTESGVPAASALQHTDAPASGTVDAAIQVPTAADAQPDAAAAEAGSSATRARARRRGDGEASSAPADSGAAVAASTASATAVAAATPGGSKPAPQRVMRMAAQIPQELLDDPDIARAIAVLPRNYNFEIYKTLWRLREAKATMVGLQFPEGLLMYACIISDILQRFAQVDTVIMGDVTYGACCVDDFTARALGCDFMVHYGHSCLVPIDVSTIHMLYVFVDIAIDTAHLVRSLKAHFSADAKIVLAGTIQFATAMCQVASELLQHFPRMLIPQARPLSKGEVLGCTSPKLDADVQAVVFLADGRFHLESLMIHNPHVPQYFKYDPYGKRLTVEEYAHEEMYTLRQSAISTASTARRWGLILGTLGRQGNTNILARLESLLKQKNLPYVIVLLSEIFPDKLAKFKEVEAWVQVACPRLSIDWGYAFSTPLLSSYEAEVALAQVSWQPVYPMDYYAESGGRWSNYHKDNKQSVGASGASKGVNPIKARKEARAAAAAAAAASKAKTEIAYAPEEATA